MRMTCRLPDHAACVEALLEGFVLACMVCIEAGLAPNDPADAPNVRYRLEPPGEEDWKLPQNVVRDGWGDCEDLAGWRAAGLRLSGDDPEAKAVVVRTGENKLHAVVRRSSGDIDDPSLELFRRQKGAERGRAVTVDHRSGGNASAPNMSTYRAAQERGRASDALTQVSPLRDAQARGEEARKRAGETAQFDRRNAGRSLSQETISREDSAAKGFTFDQATGGYKRMNASQAEDYATYGEDPSGAYNLEADQAAEDAELQAQQYGEEAYAWGGYGGSFGADYAENDGEGGWQGDGTWVDPRAVAAFKRGGGGGDINLMDDGGDDPEDD